MNRKMTLLALGANCDARGASGLTVACAAPPAAIAWREKKPALSSRPARATPVKPAPACQRNSRRVRPQNVLLGRLVLTGVASSRWSAVRSLLVVGVQKDEPLPLLVVVVLDHRALEV